MANNEDALNNGGLEEIEAILQAEATQFERDQEVERVMKSFRLNPYDILDLPYTATDRTTVDRISRMAHLPASSRWNFSDVKLRYRKTSLLVHPDKCKHEKAESAFAMLAQAQSDLLDPKRRLVVASIYEDEMQRVLTEQKLEPDDARIRTTEFATWLRKQVNRTLAENEWQKRKLVQRELEEQGRKAAEMERLDDERKRKSQEEKEWEETREARVSSWRDFQNKRKVKKTLPELKPPKALVEDSSKSFIKRVNKANE